MEKTPFYETPCTYAEYCIIGCLRDLADVHQTFSKCIQNTRELLDVCWIV